MNVAQGVSVKSCKTRKSRLLHKHSLFIHLFTRTPNKRVMDALEPYLNAHGILRIIGGRLTAKKPPCDSSSFLGQHMCLFKNSEHEECMFFELLLWTIKFPTILTDFDSLSTLFLVYLPLPVATCDVLKRGFL
jgi:hypothetical protein